MEQEETRPGPQFTATQAPASRGGGRPAHLRPPAAPPRLGRRLPWTRALSGRFLPPRSPALAAQPPNPLLSALSPTKAPNSPSERHSPVDALSMEARVSVWFPLNVVEWIFVLNEVDREVPSAGWAAAPYSPVPRVVAPPSRCPPGGTIQSHS